MDGYVCGTTNTSAGSTGGSSPSCRDAGFSAASSDVLALNNVGASTVIGQMVTNALGPTATVQDVSPGSPSSPGAPSVAAAITVGINVPVAGTDVSPAPPGPTPASIIEAQFDAALNSGMLGNLLASQGIDVQVNCMPILRCIRHSRMLTSCKLPVLGTPSATDDGDRSDRSWPRSACAMGPPCF